MPRLLKLALLLPVAASALAGCGQIGPLHMPGTPMPSRPSNPYQSNSATQYTPVPVSEPQETTTP